ncbi:hypothetical protein ACFQ15_17750 [Sphingomonas hankookensis]|uniref:hypothetical protein n=1 Tax=Sphingomonas hankookensis TaxID=563996 RepID=UPI001F5750F8|nr:hypothetical protein [Sphingomonas hankookensis]
MIFFIRVTPRKFQFANIPASPPSRDCRNNALRGVVNLQLWQECGFATNGGAWQGRDETFQLPVSWLKSYRSATFYCACEGAFAKS